MPESFTSLKGVKWSRSTLLKTLDQTYSFYYQSLIQKNLTIQEKNDKINHMLKIFLPIFNAVYEYGITVKK